MSYSEHCRFEYPDLKASEWVLDVGGYLGNFALELNLRYRCNIQICEPVFFAECAKNIHLSQCAGMSVFPNAVGAQNGVANIHLKNNSSGFYADTPETIPVKVVSIVDILRNPFALVKLNCEGSEYDILDAALSAGPITQARNWQIQWHDCVPDCVARRKSISEALSATHILSDSAPNDWENWRLKE